MRKNITWRETLKKQKIQYLLMIFKQQFFYKQIVLSKWTTFFSIQSIRTILNFYFDFCIKKYSILHIGFL
jgi:hypothetical protein